MSDSAARDAESIVRTLRRSWHVGGTLGEEMFEAIRKLEEERDRLREILWPKALSKERVDA